MAAIDDLQVGQGYLPHAYGKHAVAGILASHRVNTSGSTKQVDLKVILGRGQWDACELLTYDWIVIDPSNYTFHPGNASTGPSDPTQGTDSRFSSQIFHGNVAYYTASLPAGITNDDQPSKMVGIFRTRKVSDYWSDGSVNNASIYSINPADHFVDLIKMNCERLGLNLVDHVDWQAYSDAWNFYAENITTPDYSKIPKNFYASTSSGGSLNGVVSVSIQAKNGSDFSQRTGEVTLTFNGGSASRLVVIGDAVSGATGYRIWLYYSGTYYYTDSATPNATIDALGTAGTPSAATGWGTITSPRFWSNVAFTQPTSFVDALNAVMWQCCSTWQKAGKKYRILIPTVRPVQHTFTVANTMPGTFKFWRTEMADRTNRITANYRELYDPYLSKATPVTDDRTSAQDKVGIIEEELSLHAMTRHQATRIVRYRMIQEYDRNLFAELEDDGSAAHVLPGDVVAITDSGAGWTSKEFLVLEIERGESDAGDRRKFIMREWNIADYANSLGDNMPISTIDQPDVPSKFAAPPAITNLTLTQNNEVKADGTVVQSAMGSIQFAAHTVPQLGLVFRKQGAGGSYEMVATVSPDPATNVGGFRDEPLKVATYYYKVVTVSLLGVQQAGTPTEYSINITQYLVAPLRPTSGSATRRNSVARYTWVTTGDKNISRYRITTDETTPVRANAL